jgi:hypothetical protein
LKEVKYSTGRKSEIHTLEYTPKITKYQQKWFIGHTGEYKGFVNWLVELFDELKIPYQPFRSSIIIELNGETLTLFQHKKNLNWFYFSDKFKAKNFKRFFSRIKKYIINLLGKEISKIFEKFEKIMFDDLGELVEYTKQKFKKAKSEIKIRGKEILFNFFGIFKFNFKPYSNQLTINVAQELFRHIKAKKRIKNTIFKLIDSIMHFFNIGFTKKVYITFREMPQWVLV